jgi:glycosyltransferase involved in cell wall biosynthesis
MHILIVSSLQLNPTETFWSSFELTQAKQLAQTHQVAVLAVRLADENLGSGSRALLRRAVAALAAENLKPPGKAAVDVTKRGHGMSRVNVHHIEGVTVYEAVCSRSLSERSFEVQLDDWATAALAAFDDYRAAHGRPDLVHAHGRFLAGGAFALKLKTMMGIPYVYTEHSSYYHRGIAPVGTKPVLKQIIENASEYSAVSPFLAESVARYIGSPVRDATILANVLDEIYEREPFRAPPNRLPFVFTNIATLYDHKGVDILLKAFAEAFRGQQSYTLKLCGRGPQKAKLQSLACELDVGDQVEFLGHISKGDVLRQIDNSHVVVLSSRVETFGVPLIEAMARGRPVISTRCGGPDSMVKPALGLLVEVDNIPQMAAALRQMATNVKIYNGTVIRQNALDTYGSNVFRRAIDSMYQAALTNPL